MYKVLIVDDEKIVRMGMKNIINWNAEGFQVLNTASDGEEALNIIKTNKPHIVITDLKMGEKDGIELIKDIKRNKYECKIIVLSNYGEYDLVREAMKQGAKDYLLKVTLTPNELLEILQNVKDELNDENKEKEIEIKRNEEITENEQIAKKAFLRNILENSVSDHKNIVSKLERFKLNKINTQCHMIYIKFDDIFELDKSKFKNKKQLSQFITSLLEENISNVDFKEIITMEYYEYVIFLGEDDKIAEDISTNIMKNIILYFNLTVTVVISNLYNGIKDLNEQFMNSKYLNGWKFYKGNNLLITNDEYGKFQEFDYKYFIVSKKLKEFVQIRDFQKVFNIIIDVLNTCKEKFYNPKQIKKFIIFMIDYIEGEILNDFDSYSQSFREIERNKEQILSCEYITTLVENLKKVFKQIYSIVYSGNKEKYREEIIKVINFINDNLKRKITLKMLAKAVNMNESYLSRIFKNETGKTLVYYINEVKMKKALELLKQKETLVKEAAIEVGIDDQFYFNKVFKKFYKISPTQFKKQYLNID